MCGIYSIWRNLCRAICTYCPRAHNLLCFPTRTRMLICLAGVSLLQPTVGSLALLHSMKSFVSGAGRRVTSEWLNSSVSSKAHEAHEVCVLSHDWRAPHSKWLHWSWDIFASKEERLQCACGVASKVQVGWAAGQGKNVSSFRISTSLSTCFPKVLSSTVSECALPWCREMRQPNTSLIQSLVANCFWFLVGKSRQLAKYLRNSVLLALEDKCK